MQVGLCYVNVDFLQEVCIFNKLSFRSKKYHLYLHLLGCCGCFQG